jgi:hypothetical protein
MPFTTEQFFEVFAKYNAGVWPAQLLLQGAALLVTWLALRHSAKRTGLALALLAGLWSWAGVVYHWLNFAAINPAAYGFGAVFVLQAMLLAWSAWRGTVQLEFGGGWSSWTGVVLVASALVAYPLIGLWSGHPYLGGPTFGAPCPLTIFTFGVLLLARRGPPLGLLAIPLAWTVVATSAAFSLGVLEDRLLPLAAAASLAVWWVRRRSGVDAGQPPGVPARVRGRRRAPTS